MARVTVCVMGFPVSTNVDLAHGFLHLQPGPSLTRYRSVRSPTWGAQAVGEKSRARFNIVDGKFMYAVLHNFIYKISKKPLTCRSSPSRNGRHNRLSNTLLPIFTSKN